MRAYITATSAISPQQTFQEEAYLSEIVVPDGNYFAAKEPAYKDYIDPKLSRRMSRIIKMSVASARQCLQTAGVEQAGAIIVGTSLGCLQDTEKFLADLLENKEGLLSPTSFIQSTHNTIAGQIALILNCPHHNFTYVQRGQSFERALEDGLLQLQEGTEQVLVGGVDEMTPTLYDILLEAGCAASTGAKLSDSVSTSQKPAWGEGASFFLLSTTPSTHSVACIEDMHAFYQPRLSTEEIEAQLKVFLEDCQLSLTDIDAVMMGVNGYAQDDALYHTLYENMFPGKLLLGFKQLCGEYFTSSAFGHHLAARLLQKQQVVDAIQVRGNFELPLRNILFYNHYQAKYHTFTLLSRCQPL